MKTKAVRFRVLALLGAIVASPTDAMAQVRPAIPAKRIAILQLGTHPVIDKVVHGLRMRLEEIYRDEAISVSTLNAGFDASNLTQMARTLIRQRPNVAVSVTTPASNALIGANLGVVPQVFTFVSNPSDIGYTVPGSVPGLTGLSDQVDYDRTLKLIREFMPSARKIGYLVTQGESNARSILAGFKRYAASNGFEILEAGIAQSTDIRFAARSLAGNVDLFLFGGDNLIASNIQLLFDVAAGARKPVFANDEQSVDAGAVAAISVDYEGLGRRTAEFAALILGGGDPERMPAERFLANQLIVNARAAATFGIAVPQSALNRAHRVIR